MIKFLFLDELEIFNHFPEWLVYF